MINRHGDLVDVTYERRRPRCSACGHSLPKDGNVAIEVKKDPNLPAAEDPGIRVICPSCDRLAPPTWTRLPVVIRCVELPKELQREESCK